MDKKNLVVCAVFENEARYLPEWLAYHRLVGVDHFVLYDNGSTDDPAAAIRNSPLAEHVTLIQWPQRPAQIAAYRHFIDIFSPGFEWVAFLDLDDFLLPLTSRSVLDTLEWQSNAAAVLVHRRLFGPGGWEEPAPGLVIESYDRRAPDDHPANRHVRAIVRCSELLDVTDNPHEFKVNGAVFNTAGYLAPNRAVQAQPCFLNLVINHYVTRSRRDWMTKLQRQGARENAAVAEDIASFDRLAEQCQTKDTTIQDFASRVRELMRGGTDGTAAEEPPRPGETVPDEPVRDETVPDATQPATAVPDSVVAAMSTMEAEAAEVFLAPPGAPLGAQPQPQSRSQPQPQPQPQPQSGAQPQAQPQPDSQPSRQQTPPPAVTRVEVAPGWILQPPDGQERIGLALVYRDRSLEGEHWVAALRGAGPDEVDPAFLLDEWGRIRDFPTDVEARAACDAALAERARH